MSDTTFSATVVTGDSYFHPECTCGWSGQYHDACRDITGERARIAQRDSDNHQWQHDNGRPYWNGCAWVTEAVGVPA